MHLGLLRLAWEAHAYRAGDDPDDIEYALAGLRALAGEIRRLTKMVRTLPRDLCPENKIRPELAGNALSGYIRSCWPWTNANAGSSRFEHPTHGKELEQFAEGLVPRGPAAGIIAIFATQRPGREVPIHRDQRKRRAPVLPQGHGHHPNDQVLGTSAHKNGIKATIFSRRDVGIGG